MSPGTKLVVYEPTFAARFARRSWHEQFNWIATPSWKLLKQGPRAPPTLIA